MMQKKGVAWWYVFEFTLGTIILGLIIYIFFPNLIPYPSKIWNETRSAFDKHEGEFKPYEDQLTSEEKSVDDSMKSLMCAASSTAAGKIDDIYCVTNLGGIRTENSKISGKATTDNLKQTVCNGVIFGTKCVECTFPNKDNSVGKDKMPAGGFYMTKESVQQLTTIGGKSPIANKRGCTVVGFELPQDFSGITANDWITGANDPRWLVYHGAFPVGEETAWQISTSSFLTDVIFFGAALNAIPVAGPIAGRGIKKGVGLVTKTFAKEVVEEGIEKVTREGFEKTLREAGQAMGKELSEKAISEFTEIFYEEGYQRLLKSDLLYENLIKKGIAPEVAEEVRENTFKRWTWYARQGKGRELVFDDAALKRLTTNIEEEVLQNVDETVKITIREEIESISKRTLSESLEKSLKNKQAIKQFFARNLLDESGEKLSRESLERLFTKKVSKEIFEKLPAEAEERFFEKALSYSDEIFKIEEGIVDINLKDILGTIDEGIINGIKTQFTDFFDKSYGTFMTDDWLTSVKNLAVGDKPFKIPLQVRIGTKKIPFTGKYRPAVLRSIFKSAGASGLAVGTDAYNLFIRSRLGRYTTAIVIGNWLAQADAQNEKFKGRGLNAFVVSTPYDFGSNPKYNPPDIANYYIQLAKEEGDSSRFFLASPCKTDLTISKTTTRCEITNGAYILKETQQPIDPGSIKFDQSVVKSIFTFDEMSTEKRVALMEECLIDNLVFEDCFNSFLKKHEDTFDILIDEIFKLVDGPVIRFMKRYNIPQIPRNLNDIFNYPGVSNKDPDYRPFIIRFHDAIFPYSELGTFTSEYTQGKIDEEGFKAKLRASIIRDFYTNENLGESQEKIRLMVNAFYTLSKESPLYFSNVFNANDGVFFLALRDYALYYYILDDSKIDKSNTIKICNKPQEVRKGTEGILIKDNSISEGWSIVDTVSILSNMEKYKGNWNNGYNYCFSGSHTGITALKWLANGIAIAIDMGVGMTGVGLLVEAPVTFITGGGAALASRYLSKYEKWPYH